MLRSSLLTPVFLCLLVVGFGCAETNSFRADGFRAEGVRSRDVAYSVKYLDPSSWRLLPREWKLDNYFYSEEGKPVTQKDDGLYCREIWWTLSDGRSKKVDLVVHDLKYLHNSGAVLSVRRVPVPFQMRAMKLSAVAEEWANSNNGTVVEFSFDSKGNTAESSFSAGLLAKRTASKLIDSQPRAVSGRPAREVTFDLVDVDQLQFNPQAPRTRVRALFIPAQMEKRLGFDEIVPAFLLVAYAHDADKFDTLVPDYESLVSRIGISH